jgi:hypothetical protein
MVSPRLRRIFETNFINGGHKHRRRIKEDPMSRLIRLDRTGHTELASWTADDASSQEAAIEAFRRELDEGMLASASLPNGSAEVVRELPLDADLVVMRRPIAGG